MPKPFDPRELAARIQAIMRRARSRLPAQRVMLGHWALDVKRRTLISTTGEKRELAGGEFRLLA